jgi:hypothetical protein
MRHFMRSIVVVAAFLSSANIDELRCHATLWFFRSLAAVAVIEEAGSWRQRTDLGASEPSRSSCRSQPMDLFSHWGGMRFVLRRCALLVPLGAPRAFFLGGGSAAASLGATVAL